MAVEGLEGCGINRTGNRQDVANDRVTRGI